MGIARTKDAAPASGWRTVGTIAAAGMFVGAFFIPARVPHYLLPHLAFVIVWLLWGASRFPRAVTDLLIAAAALNAIGWAWRWLDVVPMYDELAHGFVTFALLLPAMALLHRDLPPPRGWRPVVRFALATLGLGLAGGVGWEIYEWLCDQYLIPSPSMDINDTIFDLIADLIGSAAAIPVALAVLREQRRNRSRATARGTR